MLIYTGCYICLLVMIIFKGRKLIKGRKMDSCAAQGCSLKPAAVATLSPVPTLRGPRGCARVSQCWLVAEAHLICHRQSLCPQPHPCALVPTVQGFGHILPFPWALQCSSHSPHSPLLLAASAGAFRGFYPSPLGVQKVSMFNGLFQTDLI